MYDLCRELIDNVSPVWVMDNWSSLSLAYPLKQFFAEDPYLFLAWMQRWAKLAPHLYVSWDTEKDFGNLFQGFGEKVFQTWDSNFIVHLFRLSNLCDEWQRHLFKDSKFKTRHPTIPWEDLEVEEEARKFAEKMEDEYFGPRPPPSVSLKISSKTNITFKTPAVEIWPRAPFYAFEFPSYILIPDVKERLRFRRARLKIFLREVVKNPDYPYLESWRKSFQRVLPYYLKRKISPEERNTSIKLPSTQEQTIAWASSEKSSERYAALIHGKIPENLQSKLATHPDFATRLALAVNPKVTSEILSQLASDLQPSVRAVAQARIACGSSSISLSLGEILSPGEILWLLVSHPAIFFEFGVTSWGDGSPTYRQWVSTQILQHPQWQYQIGGVFSWAYLGGMIFEEGEREDLPHHCALSGLSSLACGHWPCIFLGTASQPL